MNRSEALVKIQHSLATEEAQVITPPGESYPSYVARLSERQLASVIEPVLVKVTAACALEGDFEKFRESRVWAIARNAGSWLLILDTDNLFALGFGEDPENIMMHGFASSDALGEWCA